MTILQALVLALVQGITEFLPISSSAHLILTPYLFGWRDQGLVFDVATNTGTLAAVMVYFRRDLADLTRALLGESPAVATAPSRACRRGGWRWRWSSAPCRWRWPAC